MQAPEQQDHGSQGTPRSESAPEALRSLPDLVYGQRGWTIGQWAQWPAILSGMSPAERFEALAKRQPGVDGSFAQDNSLPPDQQEALYDPGDVFDHMLSCTS